MTCHIDQCDDGATTAQSVLLVLSNVAFLVAAVVACVRRFFPEFAYLLVMTVVSAMYHLCAGGIACFGTDCGVMRVVDNVFAYTLITVVALFVLQYDVPHNTVYKYVKADKSVGTFDGGVYVAFRHLLVLTAFAFNGVLVTNDSSFAWTPAINVIYAVVVVLLVRFAIPPHRLPRSNYHLWYLAGAIVFGTLGVLAFFFDDSSYWSFHTSWHVAAAIAVIFLFLMHERLPAGGDEKPLLPMLTADGAPTQPAAAPLPTYRATRRPPPRVQPTRT
jgi:Protein of unknown function (DUF3522)